MKTSLTNETKQLISEIILGVRLVMESRYGRGVCLCGHCIEASEDIVNTTKLYLPDLNIHTVEGYVYYDDEHCSTASYNAHTWVEIEVGSKRYIVDVTADQFNFGMDPENRFLPVIFVDEIPHGYSYELKEEDY